MLLCRQSSLHVDSLHKVFDHLKQASLTLNLAKCEFGKAVVYLGKKVGQGKVRLVDAKAQAILDFPAPQFLGMAGYYPVFCKKLFGCGCPIHQFSQSKIWGQTTIIVLFRLPGCSAPVLAAPDLICPFRLEADASALGTGAGLLQKDKYGIDPPVCYFSKKFKNHQLHYSTIEKQALALLMALQHFEVYVSSNPAPTTV